MIFSESLFQESLMFVVILAVPYFSPSGHDTVLPIDWLTVFVTLG